MLKSVFGSHVLCNKHANSSSNERQLRKMFMIILGVVLFSSGQSIGANLTACSSGSFGWTCALRCNCKDDEVCDPVTGECPTGCDDDHWGVGCLLDNDCTYNDDTGRHYMGKKTYTEDNKPCMSWISVPDHPASHFPDKEFGEILDHCRNPNGKRPRPWCYSSVDKAWGRCSVRPCDCPPGRFSENCQLECHCSNSSENCSPTGVCQSGCQSRWTGPSCQDCAAGFHGSICEKECHCMDTNEVCNRSTGVCKSGCARGWTGDSCQTGVTGSFHIILIAVLVPSLVLVVLLSVISMMIRKSRQEEKQGAVATAPVEAGTPISNHAYHMYDEIPASFYDEIVHTEGCSSEAANHQSTSRSYAETVGLNTGITGYGDRRTGKCYWSVDAESQDVPRAYDRLPRNWVSKAKLVVSDYEIPVIPSDR